MYLPDTGQPSVVILGYAGLKRVLAVRKTHANVKGKEIGKKVIYGGRKVVLR